MAATDQDTTSNSDLLNLLKHVPDSGMMHQLPDSLALGTVAGVVTPLAQRSFLQTAKHSEISQ